MWAELVRRRMPQIEQHAAREYLDGFASLRLPYDRLPNLNARLGETGAPHRMEHNAGERIHARAGFF